MPKIWLTLAVFLLAAPLVSGLPPARAEETAVAPTEQDHVLGKPDAPVTIIEYASLTCPHCAEFDKVTLPEIKKNWIDTGKAKLVFRVFPLNSLDLRAAMLASCVPEDKYFAFVDQLYQYQGNWMGARDPERALAGIGRLSGVSEDKVKTCMTDKAIEDAVVGTAYTGQTAGVQSTPTFFINGVKPPAAKNGAQPYAVFDELLTAALPKG
jgi:protein-disulfide isomerase